ncbi:hypothetical protein EYF80_050246 [Liparis tanakae]|uniref:Uncharacterized protein n=1 Tax=Liparis tanakae TaxID=230148 RepID=A0A4Z2FF67_9TELE|nr:hypothetical protein EYF80_050246 [Liparis tanakae]
MWTETSKAEPPARETHSEPEPPGSGTALTAGDKRPMSPERTPESGRRRRLRSGGEEVAPGCEDTAPCGLGASHVRAAASRPGVRHTGTHLRVAEHNTSGSGWGSPSTGRRYRTRPADVSRASPRPSGLSLPSERE